jgi:hypothetical protein
VVAGIDETLVRKIVTRLLGVVQPDRLILFGPAATGQMTPDNDLLVVAASPVNTVEVYGRLHQAHGGLGFPFDVFLIATDRFEEIKEIFGGIADPAHKSGRVIYEAA